MFAGAAHNRVHVQGVRHIDTVGAGHSMGLDAVLDIGEGGGGVDVTDTCLVVQALVHTNTQVSVRVRYAELGP